MRSNDELSSERGNRPSIQKLKVRPHTAIALACLDAVMPKGLKVRVKREALAILVQVPDASWSEAVVTGLKRYLPFPQPPSWIRVQQRKRSDPSPFDKQEVASALAQGDCTIITTTSADACLSPGLTAFADVTIAVTPPSASVLAQLLRTLVGRRGKGKPCAEIPEGLCNGLDLDEIAMAFRPGSAPEDVIRRLKLCQSAKQPSAPETTSSSWGIGAVPPLQELHGYGEAKAWGLELIDDLAAFHAGRIPFSALSARAVLASEPGLGKTSFVRSLAHSAGLPLVASSVATWFTRKSGHLGDVLSAIDQAFAEARERAPAILFFDEIDALPSRSGLDDRNRDYWLPVITHMLTLLDSVVSAENEKLVIVAATNHADALDPALVRPGRLDRIIRIGHPDASAIAGMLRQHLGEDLAELDLKPIAQLALGSTGAEVMGLIKKARALARAAGCPLAASHLMNALAPSGSGRSPQSNRVVAIHEAGHAVAATLLMPDEISHASLVPQGRSGGHTQMFACDQSVMTRTHIENRVTVLLSGYAAEALCFNEVSAGSSSDLEMATQLLFVAHGNAGLGDSLVPWGAVEDFQRILALAPHLRAKIEEELRRLLTRARTLLQQNRGALHAVAEALLSQSILSGEAIQTFVVKSAPPPAVKACSGRTFLR